jgi:heat shock protein 4
MDWVLLEYFSKKFQAQYDLNPMKNHKAKLRMLDVIEKTRKVLSANFDSAVTVECLIEDCDLAEPLSR